MTVGRPRLFDQVVKIICRVSPEMKSALMQLALDRHVTESDLIREAVTLLLAGQRSNKTGDTKDGNESRTKAS